MIRTSGRALDVPGILRAREGARRRASASTTTGAPSAPAGARVSSRPSRAADLVVVCPSNPVTSVGPILAVPGIVDALVRTRSARGRREPDRRRRGGERPRRRPHARARPAGLPARRRRRVRAVAPTAPDRRARPRVRGRAGATPASRQIVADVVMTNRARRGRAGPPRARPRGGDAMTVSPAAPASPCRSRTSMHAKQRLMRVLSRRRARRAGARDAARRAAGPRGRRARRASGSSPATRRSRRSRGRSAPSVLTEAENRGHTAAVALHRPRQRGEASRVFLTVPGDVPCVTADEVACSSPAPRATARRVFVPSRSGLGTNGVALAPPDAMPLTFGEPSFDAPSRDRARARLAHPSRARLAGSRARRRRPEDLTALLAEPGSPRPAGSSRAGSTAAPGRSLLRSSRRSRRTTHDEASRAYARALREPRANEAQAGLVDPECRIWRAEPARISLRPPSAQHRPGDASRGARRPRAKDRACGAGSRLYQATLGASRPHGPRYNMRYEVIGVQGIGEVRPGDDSPVSSSRRPTDRRRRCARGDLLVIGQKIVSKAEGRLVSLSEVEPSAIARRHGRGARPRIRAWSR